MIKGEYGTKLTARRGQRGKTQALVGGFTGWFSGRAALRASLAKQAFQFSASLIDHCGGEASRRFLSLSGKVFNAHIEQRHVLLEPTQSPLHLGNKKVFVEHSRISNSVEYSW